MKKTNKKGFTIVELVIVIAVIAILAAVLIPTFSGVVEKANHSSVKSAARNCYTELMAATDANIATIETSKIDTTNTTYGKYLTETGVAAVKYTSNTAVQFQVTLGSTNYVVTYNPSTGAFGDVTQGTIGE